MRNSNPAPLPIPCDSVDTSIPAGQSQWRWSTAVGQWNLVGCNCSGDCSVPPDFIGSYDGQVQNMLCVKCPDATGGRDEQAEDAV
jgi:hypothetical protein